MESRIFLATKKENTIGVNFNITENKAVKIPLIRYEHNGEMSGFRDTRMSALKALVEVLKNIQTENLTNIVPVFVIRSLFECIQSEVYKFWIKTGKRQTGEEISAEEMQLLKEFVSVWKEKGDNFVIRDIFNCRINDNIKADKIKLSKFKRYSRENDFYSRWCWDEIAKISNQDDIYTIEDVSNE